MHNFHETRYLSKMSHNEKACAIRRASKMSPCTDTTEDGFDPISKLRNYHSTLEILSPYDKKDNPIITLKGKR